MAASQNPEDFEKRIDAIVSDQVIQGIADLAKDYIEAGHGNVISLEIFAKKDPKTGDVKAACSSNITPPRVRKARRSLN